MQKQKNSSGTRKQARMQLTGIVQINTSAATILCWMKYAVSRRNPSEETGHEGMRGIVYVKGKTAGYTIPWLPEKACTYTFGLFATKFASLNTSQIAMCTGQPRQPPLALLCHSS